MKIEINDTVSVNYTGRFENGEVFDTSEGKEPITFQIGANQVIKGFEEALMGKEMNDTVSTQLSPSEAYGEVVESLISTINKDRVPEGVKVGDQLQASTEQGPVNVLVTDITEDSITIDGNHPMAGKTLIFDITVVNITKN